MKTQRGVAQLSCTLNGKAEPILTTGGQAAASFMVFVSSLTYTLRFALLLVQNEGQTTKF